MTRLFVAVSAFLATSALIGQASAVSCDYGEVFCCAPTDPTSIEFGVGSMIGCVQPSECPETEFYGTVGGEQFTNTTNDSWIMGSSSYCKCGPRATSAEEWGYNCDTDKCVKIGCGDDERATCHTGNVNDCIAYAIGDAVGQVGFFITLMLYLPFIILGIVIIIVVLIVYCCCCKKGKQTIIVQQAAR